MRKPAVAGMFYPGKREALEKMVDGFLEKATPEVDGALQAIIVPHAGYIYSGEVAAWAYKLVEGFRKIILIGPSHHVYMDDVVCDDNDSWETPLGAVKIAQNPFDKSSTAHKHEHCLEVQIPFLQKVLGNFEIVPLVAGDINPREYSKSIINLLDEKTLLVISSDLSHYFDYNTAVKTDEKTTDCIESLDYSGMEKYGDACGKIPILLVMDIAKKSGWKCRMLCKKNSGDTAGPKDNVVGYASFAFTK